METKPDTLVIRRNASILMLECDNRRFFLAKKNLKYLHHFKSINNVKTSTVKVEWAEVCDLSTFVQMYNSGQSCNGKLINETTGACLKWATQSIKKKDQFLIQQKKRVIVKKRPKSKHSLQLNIEKKIIDGETVDLKELYQDHSDNFDKITIRQVYAKTRLHLENCGFKVNKIQRGIYKLN